MPSLASSPTRSEPSQTSCTCETHNPPRDGLLHRIKAGVWLAPSDVWLRFCEEYNPWKPCSCSQYHRYRRHRNHRHHFFLCVSIRGLSNNRLEGRIPFSIGSLPSLVTLWVLGAAHRLVYCIQYPVPVIDSFSIHLFLLPTHLSILPLVPKILRANSAPLAWWGFLRVNPWQGPVKEPIFGANSR